MSMAPSSILVIGAGELGNAVLQSLATHPHRGTTQIDVLLRPSTISSNDEAKKKTVEEIRQLNVDLVSGDIVEGTIDQLKATFGLYHTVINCSGMFLPSGTQTRVAEAIVASDCARYFPWQFGVDYDAIGRNSSQDLFTEQLGVRDILRGQTKVVCCINIIYHVHLR